MIKIGDQFVSRNHATDPWNDSFYTVIDIKGKWVRLRHSSGYEVSHTKFDVWLSYKTIEFK